MDAVNRYSPVLGSFEIFFCLLLFLFLIFLAIYVFSEVLWFNLKLFSLVGAYAIILCSNHVGTVSGFEAHNNKEIVTKYVGMYTKCSFSKDNEP